MAKANPIRSRKLWRGVLAGAAAVPLAVFAAAPAVGATGAETSESAQTEQLGDLPVEVPGGLDPTALLDLQQCLTDLQAAVEDTADEVPDPGVPDPGAVAQLEEQIDDPPVPDVGALTEICQSELETITGAVETSIASQPTCSEQWLTSTRMFISFSRRTISRPKYVNPPWLVSVQPSPTRFW
jgi:hypothetical protein